MRFKVAALIVLFALTIVITGCSARPEEVVDAYYDLVMQRDFDRAHTLLTGESRERVSAEKFAEVWNSTFENITIENVFIQGYGTEGDQGMVSVTIQANDGNERFNNQADVRVQKEGNNWRIVLSETFGQEQ